MKLDTVICAGSYLGHSPFTENEETINMYVERVESEQGKNKVCLIVSPGLILALSTGVTARCRGAISVNGTNYAVFKDTIYKFTRSGAFTYAVAATFGPIADDGLPVTFAASPTQVAIASAGTAYYIQAGVLASISWPGESISIIRLLNTYFLMLASAGDGFFFSEPGDITAGTSTNFVAAEASSNQFIGMEIDHNEVRLFGTEDSQVFYNDKNDAARPFKPNLSATIHQGCLSGAVPIILNNSAFWISRTGVAWRAVGYQAVRISTHAVENLWRSYGVPLTDACSWGLEINGHFFWRIWFPLAGVTWQYDPDLPPGMAWTKQLYYNAALGKYEAHRGACSIYDSANNLTFIGDREDGNIYAVTHATLKENIGGVARRIRWLRRTATISNENKKTSYETVELDVNLGYSSTADGSDDLDDLPVITMRYSDTCGLSWSNGLTRNLGHMGEFNSLVRWDRGGTARQRQWEFSGMSMHPTVISNAYIEAEVLE